MLAISSQKTFFFFHSKFLITRGNEREIEDISSHVEAIEGR